MALTMRPTGLGSGIDKDRQDYTVYTGGWDIGRINEVRGGPDHLRWFWSFALHGPMTRSDRAATLEEAKAEFQRVGTLGRRGRSWRRHRDLALAVSNLLVIVKSMSLGDPLKILSTVSTHDGHGTAGVATAAPRFRTIQVCPKDRLTLAPAGS
jgi:hypothetical protein